MNHKKISLFIIKKRKEEINYKLKLLNKIEIYPIFYILLLESVDVIISIFIKKLLRFVQNNKYKIKKIIKYNLRIQWYIIKWKRYFIKENL